MSKLQKFCLVLTIICSINYAFHVLLGFDILYDFLHSKLWIEKIYAFIFGASAFINILLFKDEHIR
ncbi:hypothetical protein [Amedibacillus sp. YH-ame10]